MSAHESEKKEGCGKSILGSFCCGSSDARGTYLCNACGAPKPAPARRKKKLVIDGKLALELGYMAIYQNPRPHTGFVLLEKENEGKPHGYTLRAIFHREGDPPDEAWEGAFDVFGDEEVNLSPDERFTLIPRTRVTRTEVVTSWE